MAERPIFVPAPDSNELVRELFLKLKWHPGFARSQKEKNIESLHSAASAAGYYPLLEISTKSGSRRGRHLSAFHVKVKASGIGDIPLECAFQGSKVFEGGGPFTDLYLVDVRAAKRDVRLSTSGNLKGFLFNDFYWPLEPKTIFYDWLYVSFLYQWRDWAIQLYHYQGFTDIEFNPNRSINCQARSCALFLALMKIGALDEAVVSPDHFISVITRYNYQPHFPGRNKQLLPLASDEDSCPATPF